MRVLLVEDEVKVAGALREGLTGEGYDVTVEGTGEGAFYRASTETFDVVLLDLGLSGRDGMAVLRAVREKRIDVPVIILTARDGIQDRVRGLDAGADDSIVKPFAFAEVLARIRALLRRGAAADSRHYAVGDLSLDVPTRVVTRAGNLLDLTPREFDVLEYLLRHAGQAVSRETLAREVWQEPHRSTPLDNVIDVHMARLRKKIDADRDQGLIQTIRGVGFSIRNTS